MRRNNMQIWRTSSMGHLHRGFLIVQLLTYGVISAERACPGFWCAGGGCVAGSSLCDGTPDCPDGSDESQHNCGRPRCEGDDFACGDGHCIAPRLRCDGTDDCGDGSDETSCRSCRPDAFLCAHSGPCLTRAKLCDGRPDCPDGRDEGAALCRTGPLSSYPSSSSATCNVSELGCSDGSCVPVSWRCDGSPDCSDGVDEMDCDQDECALDNGGCSHQCLDLPLGYMCVCPRGMRLVGESKCEEINPCLQRDQCDHLCVSPQGGINGCACQTGYQQGPGPGQCRAKGVRARLVLSTSEDIRSISVGGEGDSDLIMHASRAGAMATCAATNTLYWAPRTQGSIYRVSMDASPWEPNIVLKGQGSVSGLALDWINRQLYWSDKQKGSVSVGPLDGLEPRLIIRGLQQPTAIAVDPFLRLLFWAESSSSPKIRRAGLDGHGLVTLVTSSIHNPWAIALDVPRGLLYWADRDARSISRVDLEGGQRKTVLKSNGYMDHLSGLAVFEGKVYWSDAATRSLCYADKHNGSSFGVLLRTPSPPGTLVVTHPLLQPTDVAVPRSPPGQGLPDETFAWIVSLIVFLAALLLGLTACWWWREEWRPSRTLHLQHIRLKESLDPLLQNPPGPTHQPC